MTHLVQRPCASEPSVLLSTVPSYMSFPYRGARVSSFEVLQSPRGPSLLTSRSSRNPLPFGPKVIRGSHEEGMPLWSHPQQGVFKKVLEV